MYSRLRQRPGESARAYRARARAEGGVRGNEIQLQQRQQQESARQQARQNQLRQRRQQPQPQPQQESARARRARLREERRQEEERRRRQEEQDQGNGGDEEEEEEEEEEEYEAPYRPGDPRFIPGEGKPWLHILPIGEPEPFFEDLRPVLTSFLPPRRQFAFTNRRGQPNRRYAPLHPQGVYGRSALFRYQWHYRFVDGQKIVANDQLDADPPGRIMVIDPEDVLYARCIYENPQSPDAVPVANPVNIHIELRQLYDAIVWALEHTFRYRSWTENGNYGSNRRLYNTTLRFFYEDGRRDNPRNFKYRAFDSFESFQEALGRSIDNSRPNEMIALRDDPNDFYFVEHVPTGEGEIYRATLDTTQFWINYLDIPQEAVHAHAASDHIIYDTITHVGSRRRCVADCLIDCGLPEETAISISASITNIDTVARGGTYFDSQVSDRLLSGVQLGKLRPPTRGSGEVLSPRERQVLRLTVDGKSNKEVATLLNLEVHTVRSYRKTMMAKLGASNVAELIQVTAKSGLIDRIKSTGDQNLYKGGRQLNCWWGC